MRLTDRDRSTLIRAEHLQKLNMTIIPTGAGQWAHFRRLVRLGMLAPDGYAIHEDTGEEKPCFKITGKGIVAINQEAQA